MKRYDDDDSSSTTGRLRKIASAEGLAGKTMEVVRSLKPPPSEDPEVRGWRYFIVTITVVNSLSIVAHIALACGLTPFFGGFAYASDQKVAVAESRATRVEFIEARMFDLKVQQCAAIAKGDNPRAFTVELQQQAAKYRDATRREPSLPTCEELGL